MESGKCFLCSRVDDLTDTENDSWVTVTRGIPAIINASTQREDGLEQELSHMNSINVHVKCRRSYTESKRISKAVKRKALSISNESLHQASPPILRGTDTTFDIKRDCMFCGVNQETLVSSLHGQMVENNRLVNAEFTNWKEELERRALGRNDEWGLKVHSRIAGVTGDFVSAEAKYHSTCMTSFYVGRENPRETLKPLSKKRGKKPDETLSNCLLRLYEYLENNDECQYSLSEIHSLLNSFAGDEAAQICSRRYLKQRLLDHYGDGLIITSADGVHDIVCFRDFGYKILRNQWTMMNHNNDGETSKDIPENVILDMAASILRDKIRLIQYDTSTYPSFSNPESFCSSLIPKELDVFLHNLIKSTAKDQSGVNRRCASISQVIISAVRPRSFISPLLLGISAYIHRRYGSKELIDILSHLSFADGYDEIQRLNNSFLEAGGAQQEFGNFLQTVWDNADKNIRTVTGFNTFHALGGIAIETPKSNPSEKVLKRSSQQNQLAGSFGTIPLQKGYSKPKKRPLSEMKVAPLDIPCGKPFKYAIAEALDSLWSMTFPRQLSSIPFWSGFMHLAVSKEEKYEQSKIYILNFVNFKPTDPSTLYTALRFTQDLCDRNNIKFCPVTFDQPLYIKCIEILEKHKSELKSLFVRIGGFHNVMSFMGAIGTIMGDSGLEDLWETVYAPNTAGNMQTGHDYARALRAHILSSAAVTKHIIDHSDSDVLKSNAQLDIVKDLIQESDSGESDVDWKTVHENSDVKALVDALNDLLKVHDEDSRTVKLWKTYLECTTILRLLLFSERTGDHELHVYCTKNMIPYLHAAGHNPYGRSLRIYLQQLNELRDRIPADLYEMYTKKGYFTVRRKDCFWSGNFTDQTIEQDLMRLFKSAGGLTRGRHITETTIAKFVGSLPNFIPICDYVEKFAGVYTTSSTQHKDLRLCNKARDSENIDKFNNWLNDHSFFAYDQTPGIVCISNGIIADKSVNCDEAFVIGKNIADALTGKTFDETIPRNSKVVTIRSSKKGVKVRDEIVDINPQLFFNRITSVLNNSEEMKYFLSYELSTEPVALFKRGQMRPAESKSKLATELKKNVKLLDQIDGTPLYVADGGYLLHKIVWTEGATYRQILLQHVDYVLRHFGKNTVVVMDGYGDENCTKMATRKVRATKNAAQEIHFDLSMKTISTQEAFLGNQSNKARFISKQVTFLEDADIQVKQALGDADPLIVSTALSAAVSENSRPVIVIGNDTDLQCMLVERCTDANLYMQVDTGDPSQIYQIQDAQKNLTVNQRSILNIIHCLTGCDTTSVVFNKGKKTAWKLLKKLKDDQIRDLLVFDNINASHEDIKTAGERFFLQLYGCPTNSTLNQQRYLRYNQRIAKLRLTSTFKLESLPPTSEAAAQHSFRAFHTIQQCLGNYVDATQWGWKNTDSYLSPVMTTQPPAPDSLLNMISCGCKAGCGSSCGCRKISMRCSKMCNPCSGKTCTNTPKEMDVFNVGQPDCEDANESDLNIGCLYEADRDLF